MGAAVPQVFQAPRILPGPAPSGKSPANQGAPGALRHLLARPPSPQAKSGSPGAHRQEPPPPSRLRFLLKQKQVKRAGAPCAPQPPRRPQAPRPKFGAGSARHGRAHPEPCSPPTHLPPSHSTRGIRTPSGLILDARPQNPTNSRHPAWTSAAPWGSGAPPASQLSSWVPRERSGRRRALPARRPPPDPGHPARPDPALTAPLRAGPPGARGPGFLGARRRARGRGRASGALGEAGGGGRARGARGGRGGPGTAGGLREIREAWAGRGRRAGSRRSGRSGLWLHRAPRRRRRK